MKKTIQQIVALVAFVVTILLPLAAQALGAPKFGRRVLPLQDDRIARIVIGERYPVAKALDEFAADYLKKTGQPMTWETIYFYDGNKDSMIATCPDGNPNFGGRRSIPDVRGQLSEGIWNGCEAKNAVFVAGAVIKIPGVAVESYEEMQVRIEKQDSCFKSADCLKERIASLGGQVVTPPPGASQAPTPSTTDAAQLTAKVVKLESENKDLKDASQELATENGDLRSRVSWMRLVVILEIAMIALLAFWVMYLRKVNTSALKKQAEIYSTERNEFTSKTAEATKQLRMDLAEAMSASSLTNLKRDDNVVEQRVTQATRSLTDELTQVRADLKIANDLIETHRLGQPLSQGATEKTVSDLQMRLDALFAYFPRTTPGSSDHARICTFITWLDVKMTEIKQFMGLINDQSKIASMSQQGELNELKNELERTIAEITKLRETTVSKAAHESLKRTLEAANNESGVLEGKLVEERDLKEAAELELSLKLDEFQKVNAALATAEAAHDALRDGLDAAKLIITSPEYEYVTSAQRLSAFLHPLVPLLGIDAKVIAHAFPEFLARVRNTDIGTGVGASTEDAVDPSIPKLPDVPADVRASLHEIPDDVARNGSPVTKPFGRSVTPPYGYVPPTNGAAHVAQEREREMYDTLTSAYSLVAHHTDENPYVIGLHVAQALRTFMAVPTVADQSVMEGLEADLCEQLRRPTALVRVMAAAFYSQFGGSSDAVAST